MPTFTIFNRPAEICTSGDTRRFAATFNVGAARKGCPAGVADAIARLANGPTPLTADEKANLGTLGIAFAPVPRETPSALGNRLLSEGVASVETQRRVAEAQAQPEAFRSVEPIRSVTFYRPADFN